MTSVLRSSPPGAPRSMVSARSMPRPAYMAAHSPAGPAPTMMTSYPFEPVSVMRPEFQSRGVALSRQGARQLRAEAHRFELHRRVLRARQFLERRRPHGGHAVAVAPTLVQQPGPPLNPPLPHPGRPPLPPNKRNPPPFPPFLSPP